uniref:Uncharacterized protein n=1 Tax=Lactuca sativa TaxID=4236 RepID=A0A9R1WUS0_LACSA|nr:hypothetical protein LSAT_V11C900496940 [Lactuca sativa]
MSQSVYSNINMPLSNQRHNHNYDIDCSSWKGGAIGKNIYKSLQDDDKMMTSYSCMWHDMCWKVNNCYLAWSKAKLAKCFTAKGYFSSSAFCLTIVILNVQDDLDNITRFLILAREPIIPGIDKPHKTSIVFTLEERPRVLFNALAVFALREINLSKVCYFFHPFI